LALALSAKTDFPQSRALPDQQQMERYTVGTMLRFNAACGWHPGTTLADEPGLSEKEAMNTETIKSTTRVQPKTVSARSVVVLAKNQVSSQLEGETVILNLTSGVYYSLDSVGTRIWNLMGEPRTVKGIQDTLLAQYEIEADRCERELLALLQQLAVEGLIEVQRGSGG
jgi:hypothetical protein